MTIDKSLSDRREAMQQARLARGGGGGGPHDPHIERRLTAVEADIREIKTTLQQLQLMSTRIEATLTTLATREDVLILGERVAAHTLRLSKLEDSNKDVVTLALSKTIGIAGALTLFVSMTTLFGATVAALRFFHII